MYLFIFESIGTSELILIGVIALIFLGPRKLPEIARKAGKIMSDFRNTTNEFKNTWEREVNFEEEARALRSLDDPAPVARITPPAAAYTEGVSAPEIKQVDASAFSETASSAGETVHDTHETPEIENEPPSPENPLSDKKSWL